MKVGRPEEILPLLCGPLDTPTLVIAQAEATTEEARNGAGSRPCRSQLLCGCCDVGRPISAMSETTSECVKTASALALPSATPQPICFRLHAAQMQMEAAVSSALAPAGATLRLVWGSTLLHLDDLNIAPEDFPIVFAQFNKLLIERSGTGALPEPRAPVQSDLFEFEQSSGGSGEGLKGGSAAAEGARVLLATAAGAPEDWAAPPPSLRELGYTDHQPAEARPQQRRMSKAPAGLLSYFIAALYSLPSPSAKKNLS